MAGFFRLIGCNLFFIKVIFWVAFFIYGFLCLIPFSYLPSDLFDWWDKAQHVFAFFCLSGLGIMAYQKQIGKVAIGLFFYGGLIEILQWLTGWRSGEILDWLADSIGVLLGSVFMTILIQNGASLLKARIKD